MKTKFLMVLFFLAGNLLADSVGDHWVCQHAAVYSFAPGAMQTLWDETMETWTVDEYYWSGDESAIELGIMYADPTAQETSPGYIDYYDPDTKLLWRFAFTNFLRDNTGHHNICGPGPVVFKLGE